MAAATVIQIQWFPLGENLVNPVTVSRRKDLFYSKIFRFLRSSLVYIYFQFFLFNSDCVESVVRLGTFSHAMSLVSHMLAVLEEIRWSKNPHPIR